MVPRIRLKQFCIVFFAFVTTSVLVKTYDQLSIFITKRPEENNPFSERSKSRGIRVIVTGGDDKSSTSKKNSRKGKGKPSWLGQQQACNIPRLDINGSQVKHFFSDPKPLNCEKKAKKNWLFIDKEGNYQLIKNRKNARCKAVYFSRVNDNENKETEPTKVVIGQPMEQDFARVTCTYARGKWSGLLMSVARRDDVINRLAPPTGDAPLNVFFLGFDSLSQMSFRRKLPKTLNFLENVLGSVVLNGYNIVGDGTPQAFIPILTARTENEMPNTRKRYRDANYVDDVYPFIWKNFSAAGYATLYGEDAFRVGTFTYRLKGFRNQPTDHYTRTFFKEQEKSSNWDCVGSKPLHESWFSYARDFMRVYSSLPRFLMMHQGLLSHDDINKVQVQDEYLSRFLREMHEEGYFNNTLVVVMADHGHRFAKLRETHQGQLEERLPFFSLALPPNFVSTEKGAAFQRNLQQNKNRLTTPFDIHSTLMDIVHPPSLDDVTKQPDVQLKRRSLSLFRVIPEQRTCNQAGVEPHWCTCLNWQDAMTSSTDLTISRGLAEVVVDSINEQLKDVTHLCATVKLARIISSKKLIPNDGLLKYKNGKDADGFVPDLTGNAATAFAHYQIKLQTMPNAAIYEVTLFYDLVQNEVHLDLTSLSHVTKYGLDPHCIIDQNYFLATYCVCHDKVTDS